LFLVYIAHKYHIEGVGATYLFLSVATMMFIVFLSLYILLDEHFIMNWRLSLFGTFLICKNIYLLRCRKSETARKMDKDKLMQEIATGGIIGTLSATIRALMTNNETLLQRIKTFTAGVCMAILLAILLAEAPLKEFWKEMIIGAAAAFISSIWPLLERGVIKLVKKKTNDVIKNSDVS
jgi:hypothetical protein